LEGNSKEAIEEAIAETWPDEKEKPLIVAAMSALRQSAKSMQSNASAWCIEALRFLYQKQVEIGEYAGAMRAVKQISDLATPAKPGATVPQQQPTIINNIGVQVDARVDAARRAEICEVAEQVRARLISVEPADG
jgi:hypothetical protein